jgi:hypothetical protein
MTDDTNIDVGEIDAASDEMADCSDCSSGPTEPTLHDAPKNDAGGEAARNRKRNFEATKAMITPCLVVPPRNWEFLFAPDRRAEVDMDTAEFFAIVEEGWGEDRLLESRIYERCGDTVRLADRMDVDAPLFVTFDEEEGEVYFTWNEDSLFSLACTALEYATAANSAESAGQENQLFVCDSPDAARIVQRLGLPAVSCDGLEAIGHQDIKRLFGDGHRGHGWKYFLVLLDFDLCQLDPQPTAALADVIARLTDAADVYGVDLSERFAVCRPNASEMQRLRRAVGFADPSAVRQLLDEWAAHAVNSPISDWQGLLHTEGVRLSTARAELKRAIAFGRRDPSARQSRVEAALQDYKTALEAKIVQPFDTQLDTVADGYEALEIMHTRDIASSVLQTDLLLCEAEAVIADAPPPTYEEDFEHVERQIMLMSALQRRPQHPLAKRITASMRQAKRSRATHRRSCR